MKKLMLTLVAALALVGCATNQEYLAYSEAHKAFAAAEAARFKALAEIAKQGDTTAKVAATMALQQAGSGNHPQQIAAPKSTSEIALQWTGLLLPNLTQLYSINRNSAVAIQQSNNATQLGIHQSTKSAEQTAANTAAFVGIAGKIQAPQANITVTSGNGGSINAGTAGTSTGSGAYTTTDTRPSTVTTTTTDTRPSTVTTTNNNTQPTTTP